MPRSSSRLPVTFSTLLIAFLAQCSAFAQNTIHVPGDQATVQGAINAANNGDTVLVAPGTYVENINFSGKAITVTSSGGAAQTVLDGGMSAPVVTFSGGEGLNSVLNGLTLQNGRSTFASFYEAGGIYVGSASPTITNNVIQNNAACSDGGGISVGRGSPLIQGNTIQNNTQSACSGGSGGSGIAIGGIGSAQIIGNLIANNSWRSGNGGGISLNAAGTPTIRGNIITGNTATGVSPAAQGGGIYAANNSNALIVQNLIYNNNAGQGSGIYLSVSSGDRGPLLVNNTIIGGSGSNLGSALYAIGFDNQVVLFNNLLVGASGQNAVYCDGTYQSQPPTFTNNNSFSASGTAFAGTCAGSAGQNGNVSADPLFVNSASDFHLQPTSPAIDAGTNAAPNLPQTDFGGNPRILDGNNDCISTVDMGAYELVQSAAVSFSTSSLAFAGQPLNTSSSPKPATLSNTGATCFQFSKIGITGDFSQMNNCGAAGVRGGTSCTFNVTFTPAALGTRLGGLTVSGSDGITSASPSVNLSGVGADFSVAVSPSSATVKHGQSTKFTVTVSPLGGAFTSGVALSCSGLPSGALCSFSPSSVTPGENGATSVMTVSTVGKTPRGNYSILIVGKSGSDSHSATIMVTVD